MSGVKPSQTEQKVVNPTAKHSYLLCVKTTQQKIHIMKCFNKCVVLVCQVAVCVRQCVPFYVWKLVVLWNTNRGITKQFEVEYYSKRILYKAYYYVTTTNNYTYRDII